MKSYNSLKAAERALVEDEQFFLDQTFCPLIQKNCNSFCVCVERPKIKKVKNNFEVTGHVRCSNYMFKGGK